MAKGTLKKAGNKLGDRFCDQADNVVNVAEAIIHLRQLAENALFFQVNEALKGKDDVEVLIRQAVIVVGMGIPIFSSINFGFSGLGMFIPPIVDAHPYTTGGDRLEALLK